MKKRPTRFRLGFGLGLGMGCVLAASAAAVPSPSVMITPLSSGIPHAALFGLSFDAGHGVAVGIGGAIYESGDAGASWRAVRGVPTRLALLGVERRGAHTVAVGQMGVVLVEARQGSWKKCDSGGERRLLAVSVNASGLAFAVGEFGTVLRSTDGGCAWTADPPDWASMADKDTFGTGEPTIYAVHVADSGEVTIAGEFGVMMRSADGGASWQVVRPVSARAPAIFAMHIAPRGEGNSYAVGQTGELLVSADGGTTWREQPRFTRANYLGVAASGDGKVVITGMRTMLRSVDAGASWSFINNADTQTEWYQSVRSEQTTGRILAVGHDGRIIQIGG